MSEKSASYNGGIGFCGLLAIVFITLKLTGYIDWSWWWVLAPIWIPWAFVLVIIALIFGGVVVSEISYDRKRWK